MQPHAPRSARDPQVGVIVIGYNDAAHVTTAVRSALAQGPAVREVVAVDDCSTDDSVALLTRLAATYPRVKVVRRRVNSGGCGSPRNTGLDRVTAPYVMFLDSDDVLPPGAVDSLLAAATGAGAEVAGGLCVRRELPEGREVPWQASLYAAHAVVERPAQRPRLVHDTLCVNKLYRTDFLREHGIRFPEGRFPYEDFVFTARVLAAGPRIALVPDRVYVWHVRRSAHRLSISLDRADIGNWRARTEASRVAHEILLGAGQKELARAARAKFLDHELRMYTRELGLHDSHYQRAWWAHTRAYLAEYDASDWAHNPTAPGRLIGRVILASPEPRDLPRLRDLASRPARLLPPYAHVSDGTPVWSADLPQLTLEPLLTRPVRLLPLAVDAELRPRARAALLRLRLHELYGRVAQAGPEALEVEWRCRETGRAAGAGAGAAGTTVGLTAAGGGVWTAEVAVGWAAFGGSGEGLGGGGERFGGSGQGRSGKGTWDLRLRVRFRGGAYREVTAHALTGPGLLRRRAVVSARHAVILVQPYAAHSGALALHVAPGLRGVTSVVRGRLRRLLH
ncbi:glycosyltransferase family 2 protein [Streptomyces sp. ISL-22]|uniref:glycosyltransferase family 2 protein n=1 Tax=unclassified Streptomyces TaxID=2593676 RepID=UPI001BE983D1|nr:MULTISPECIES: glycosyltransferase family A protein [unclassified Streptomyces]MBT2423571.1 glycosyltransferase family 2 protein [Streptomyces sp. ISL-24]MBT2432905.1 glycosyltransferase family 2 protein [Streptomyces sp. ISL-22]